MGCDMVVAVGPATENRHTLFGTNYHGVAGAGMALRLNPGRAFELGETVQTQVLQLPQARQTFNVLGNQPLNTWGYQHGINEYEVVAACCTWRSKLVCDQPGLTGTDLVRLLLERCRSARQGFDLLTGLVSRHGQCRFTEGRWTNGEKPGTTGNDHIFLLADPTEAYLVEAAGSAWASLECMRVRAVSDVGLIRQDWQRLSAGLAEQAITHGWWPDDGSKLDFHASLSVPSTTGEESALRRWGRATLLLEEQSGHIDSSVLRRLLADHYEETSSELDPLAPRGSLSLCRHASPGQATATTANFIAELGGGPERPPMAWCAFGPPCVGIYLPLFLDGELPMALGRADEPLNLARRFHQLQTAISRDRERWTQVRHSLALLQARLDQQTEEFCAEAAVFKRKGEHSLLRRQAGIFMQNQLEQLEDELQRMSDQWSAASSGLAMQLTMAIDI
jgi:secernin